MAGRTNEGKSRRTQEERSAMTRQALLDATIRALHKFGYGATTAAVVADLANVSRGAMLHQFRTKAEMMTFVLEQTSSQHLLEIERQLNKIDGVDARLMALPEIIWNVLSKPSGVAALEILQGSRSDIALATKLRPIQEKIEQMAARDLRRDMGGLPTIALMQLLPWAIRGLSISTVVARDDSGAKQAIQLLRSLIEAGLAAGTIRVTPDEPATAA